MPQCLRRPREPRAQIPKFYSSSNWVDALGVVRRHSVLRRVLRRFWGGFWGRAFYGFYSKKRVLRRVLRRGSEKGVSRRCLERPLGEYDPLGVRPIKSTIGDKTITSLFFSLGLRSAPPHTGVSRPLRAWNPGRVRKEYPEAGPQKCRIGAPAVSKEPESQVLDSVLTLLRLRRAPFRHFWGPAPGYSFWTL